jgi:hypothetical protein
MQAFYYWYVGCDYSTYATYGDSVLNYYTPYANVLTPNGILYDTYKQYLTYRTMYSYYFEHTYGEGGSKEVPEATLKEYLTTHYDLADTIEFSKTDSSGKDLSAEKIAELKAKADEVYERAQNGEDFDALIAEFGGDPAMNTEPYKTEGYEVSADKTTFDPIFTEAAMALENVGDICEPTYSEEYGYYILQLINKIEEGPVPLADLYDKIEETLYNEAANLVLNEKVKRLKVHTIIKHLTKMVFDSNTTKCVSTS